MQLLLDTHTLLWWLDDAPELGTAARAHIMAGTNAVFVSAVCAWEVEIKRALGKLDAPDDLEDVVERSQFEMLPITMRHAITAGRLPPHHGDPFDRMLIAQASVEQFTIVTNDAAFGAYGVALIDAQA